MAGDAVPVPDPDGIGLLGAERISAEDEEETRQSDAHEGSPESTVALTP